MCGNTCRLTLVSIAVNASMKAPLNRSPTLLLHLNAKRQRRETYLTKESWDFIHSERCDTSKTVQDSCETEFSDLHSVLHIN